MLYDKMIASEDSDKMWDEWKHYREELTTYVKDSIEHYYRKIYLQKNRKIREASFSLEQWIRETGRKPTIAVWGAGNCSDLDLEALSHVAKLVLIDREEDRIQQAKKKYGLSDQMCSCIDLGFWEIYEEEERWFESLLMSGADDAHLAQYIKSVGKTLSETQTDLDSLCNVFDFSVVSGLASQLNARFFGLMHIYGRNPDDFPEVCEALRGLDRQAVAALCDALMMTTDKMIICGNELRSANMKEQSWMEELACKWTEEQEEILLSGEFSEASVQCQVAGSGEFLQRIEKDVEEKRLKMVHRRGMMWPFSFEKCYFMDVLALETINKETKTDKKL